MEIEYAKVVLAPITFLVQRHYHSFETSVDWNRITNWKQWVRKLENR